MNFLKFKFKIFDNNIFGGHHKFVSSLKNFPFQNFPPKLIFLIPYLMAFLQYFALILAPLSSHQQAWCWSKQVLYTSLIISYHFIYPRNNRAIQPVPFCDFTPFNLVFPQQISTNKLTWYHYSKKLGTWIKLGPEYYSESGVVTRLEIFASKMNPQLGTRFAKICSPDNSIGNIANYSFISYLEEPCLQFNQYRQPNS